MSDDSTSRPGPLGTPSLAPGVPHDGVVMTGQDRDEGVKAFFIHLEARPGHEDEVAAVLADILAAVEQEPETGPWYAVRYSATSFGIFEVFPGITGRDAHVRGEGGSILRDLERMNDVLAEPAHVAKLDVVLAKLVLTHGDVPG